VNSKLALPAEISCAIFANGVMKPTEVSNAQLLRTTDDGDEVYEMSNRFYNKIKFEIQLKEPTYKPRTYLYKYTISVVRTAINIAN
jgi:hypothetical protein